MPIDSLHPSYNKRSAQWSRCRDTHDGGDAVKARKGLYLPKLSGQEDAEYAAYLLRALFFGATQRTVEGTAGAIMRKAPTLTIPPRLNFLLEDITFTGISLSEFAKQATQELFITGRMGILVDRMPEGDKRVFLSLYKAENIINWKSSNGDLMQVVLREEVEVPGADGYEVLNEVQYRELLLLDGKYVQRIHRKNASVEGWTVTTYNPTSRGKALTAIPFVFGSPVGVDEKVAKPPILDLVDVNLSHYRSSADLEHGRHFTALPTIYCSGVTAKELGGAINIGSGKVLILPPPEARAGIIEYLGTGLSEISGALREKEEQMSKLGAMLLTTKIRGVEAAETARIHGSSEESVTISIANSTSSVLTRALNHACLWEGLPDKAAVALNTDILDAKMDPKTLTALLAVKQAGEMSPEAFVYNLHRGELLPSGSTVQDELARIALEGPPVVPTEETEEMDDGNSE